MQVGIIGLGNFGTAIANLAASNGHDVLGWEYHEAVVDAINTSHVNDRFLAGVALDTRLRATVDIRAVCEKSDVLLVAIPSAFIRSTLAPVRDYVGPDTLIVNLAKGINAETGQTAFQLLSEVFPDHGKALLSGPSIANEFARGMPTTVVLAGANRKDLLLLAKILETDTFRTRFSEDVVGVELGGILKNMYAIGLGMFDGVGIKSINFRSTYLTLGLEEIVRFGTAMGGKVESFLYLAGVGDLLATSMSEHSHNRHFGEMLGSGHSIEQIQADMGVLPEGYRTIQQVLFMAEKMHVSIPMVRGLWAVMEGKMSPGAYIDAIVRG